MIVLSLFDGISCGRLSLGEQVNYYASEICEDAIAVSKANFPSIVQLGDVHKITPFQIDLLLGGSPCQDISGMNKKRSGLDGGKSKLFYEYVRLLKECKPKYFLFENVTGDRTATEEITKQLGVKPELINSNLFVPQNRRRYYWTNIKYPKPIRQHNLELKDILETNVDESFFLSDHRVETMKSPAMIKAEKKKYLSYDPKYAQCLTVRSIPSWNCNYVTQNGRLRILTPIEYERLQGLPDNYTSCLTNAKRYAVIGNSWTVPTIKWILNGLI